MNLSNTGRPELVRLLEDALDLIEDADSFIAHIADNGMGKEAENAIAWEQAYADLKGAAARAGE